MIDNDNQALKKQIEDQEYLIEMADALKRLKDNKDFKKLFMENYLADYAADLVHTRARVANESANQQEYINRQMDAVGFLGRWMGTIATEGVTAESKLEECEFELAHVGDADVE